MHRNNNNESPTDLGLVLWLFVRFQKTWNLLIPAAPFIRTVSYRYLFNFCLFLYLVWYSDIIALSNGWKFELYRLWKCERIVIKV